MFLALSCPSKESFKTGTIRRKALRERKVSRKEGKDAERRKREERGREMQSESIGQW